MQTQVWQIAELKELNVRLGRSWWRMEQSTHQDPLSYFICSEFRGERVEVEEECKITKIKAAVNIYGNTDPTMGLFREFEEKALDSALWLKTHKSLWRSWGWI